MSLANARDETRDNEGTVVYYRQWPADRTSPIDDNGTLRAMTTGELALWDAADQDDQDRTDLAAWLALRPDYLAGRDLANLGGGTLSNAALSAAAREHRQLLRKLCRGMLRQMREYEGNQG